MNLKLLYFQGCPNFQPAVDLLNSAGIEFIIVCQDDLEANSPLKDYSSPTLLSGGEIIFGSLATGGGCSVKLPTKEELVRKLK